MEKGRHRLLTFNNSRSRLTYHVPNLQRIDVVWRSMQILHAQWFWGWGSLPLKLQHRSLAIQRRCRLPTPSFSIGLIRTCHFPADWAFPQPNSDSLEALSLPIYLHSYLCRCYSLHTAGIPQPCLPRKVGLDMWWAWWSRGRMYNWELSSMVRLFRCFADRMLHRGPHPTPS